MEKPSSAKRPSPGEAKRSASADRPETRRQGRPVKPETIPFAVRLPREAREALIKAGESEERPAAWIAQRAIIAWLKTNGWLE